MLATAIQNCSRKNVVFPFEYFLKLSFPGRFFSIWYVKKFRKTRWIQFMKRISFFSHLLFWEDKKIRVIFQKRRAHSSQHSLKKNILNHLPLFSWNLQHLLQLIFAYIWHVEQFKNKKIRPSKNFAYSPVIETPPLS